MPSLIGQSLGRYHILEQLGEGGMATVYKAYDTRLERDVAVKVIRRKAFPEEQIERILKRFEREAKALAKLTHPNIVGVIDYGEYEGSPYLVMPYLPGGTLKQRLGKPILWQEAVKILLPITQALQFTHEQGIIHRDVKPSNILITLSGEPMLTDFGIAKILEGGDAQTLTGDGVGVGTPEYMAPEQWRGEATAQTDIYSLGVILYELLTGRKPYNADTPAAILLKQANEPLPQPGLFADGIPQTVEKTLYKALAKKPEDRYLTSGELADALNVALIQGGSGESRGKKGRVSRKDEQARRDISVNSHPIGTPEPSQGARAHASIRGWLMIGIVVAILGITLPLGIGLFHLGTKGQGPMAGLATATSSFSSSSEKGVTWLVMDEAQDDQIPAYADIVGGTAVLDGTKWVADIQFFDLPETVTLNLESTGDNTLEYAWMVNFDLDGDGNYEVNAGVYSFKPPMEPPVEAGFSGDPLPVGYAALYENKGLTFEYIEGNIEAVFDDIHNSLHLEVISEKFSLDMQVSLETVTPDGPGEMIYMQRFDGE